ncbi:MULTISPECIES: MarR family winged helix-turn-helix transcriptional regulator [Gordonia]|uniref:Putative MarR family transcriptional regulator n=1 Tax=Gordonia sihwensis NBRC 108236 TaxID=1223544 RepID=L7LIC2_9ACTN|nr:putative MarR family transcriptional regulator [Gordonia sihwensis NBRC 108236]
MHRAHPKLGAVCGPVENEVRTVDDGEPTWPSQVHRDVVEELLRLRRRRDEVDPKAILDASAFHILWLLSDGRARTLRELSHDLALEQSTVNRQVNAAIKRGYVERFPVDGQVSRMHRPTAAGMEALEHDGRRRADRLNRVFADLAPGDPAILLAQLRAFNDAFERQGVDAD